MRPDHRGVDTDVPVDSPRSVSLGLQHRQQPVPSAVGREAMVPLPDRLPRPEPLRQITPRNPGPIAMHDALDDLPVITPRTRTPYRLRHQRLNPSPRRLAQLRRTRHAPKSAVKYLADLADTP